MSKFQVGDRVVHYMTPEQVGTVCGFEHGFVLVKQEGNPDRPLRLCENNLERFDEPAPAKSIYDPLRFEFEGNLTYLLRARFPSVYGISIGQDVALTFNLGGRGFQARFWSCSVPVAKLAGYTIEGVAERVIGDCLEQAHRDGVLESLDKIEPAPPTQRSDAEAQPITFCGVPVHVVPGAPAGVLTPVTYLSKNISTAGEYMVATDGPEAQYVKHVQQQADVNRYAAFRRAVEERTADRLPPGVTLSFDRVFLADRPSFMCWAYFGATQGPAFLWPAQDDINGGGMGSMFNGELGEFEDSINAVFAQRARDAARGRR